MILPEISPAFQEILDKYYIGAFLIAFPMARLFLRAGFKPWWVLFLATPAVGHILCLLALAVQHWPVLPKSKRTKKHVG